MRPLKKPVYKTEIDIKLHLGYTGWYCVEYIQPTRDIIQQL